MGSCLSSVVQEILQPSASPPPSHQQTPFEGRAGVYRKLPPGATNHRVRNVYDGDTLTLVDERRVRLLGIDTPEIKERQPFAEEAKAYTKDRCHKLDIWLTFEADGNGRKDHYGRLLAFVWVPADRCDEENGRPPKGSFLCVNEGIVATGLATVYTPNESSKTHNFDLLVALQRDARNAGRGMWKNFRDMKVVRTVRGAAYHVRECRHLSKSKHLTELKASEAMDLGLHPCRTCMADA